MPNGETAQILLLEYIEGKTLNRFMDEYAKGTLDAKRQYLPRILPLVRPITLSLRRNEYLQISSIREAYSALNERNLFHSDRADENIIVNDNHVTLIDFGDSGFADAESLAAIAARQVKYPTPKEGDAVACRLLWSFLQKAGDFREEFIEWAESNVPSVLVRKRENKYSFNAFKF